MVVMGCFNGNSVVMPNGGDGAGDNSCGSKHWRRKRGARGACAPPPHFFDWGGNGTFVPPPPPLLTPHFYFPLELYVYITLTNNYLAFFTYELIILWTISIN